MVGLVTLQTQREKHVMILTLLARILMDIPQCLFHWEEKKIIWVLLSEAENFVPHLLLGSVTMVWAGMTSSPVWSAAALLKPVAWCLFTHFWRISQPFFLRLSLHSFPLLTLWWVLSTWAICLLFLFFCICDSFLLKLNEPRRAAAYRKSISAKTWV